MSLLEDVFLQDEANEAQELERVIEGDEYEGRPRSDSDDNSEKEDEAEEDKKRVDPNTTKTRRVIKNPRFVLNPARLTGPRGIQVIPDHFKDFKFKGKGHEREDLDLVLKKLEHWAYRLYPKFKFEDCLKKIETLGKKRPVMVHLHKIRSDQYLTEETVVQNDSSDEEAPPEDEFDKLLQQQIELAKATPAPGSVKKAVNTPILENRSFMMPKATSSPSISDEQKERMLKNRKLAEERRLARLKNLSNTIMDNTQNENSDDQIPTTHNSTNNDRDDENNHSPEIIENNTEIAMIRHNRSNVIDSSDEDEVTLVNESIRVDVHNAIQTNISLNETNHDTDIASNSKTDIDKVTEINDEIEILPNTTEVEDRKQIDNEDVTASNVVELENAEKNTKDDEVNLSNQEKDKCQNDDQNLKDLMDVDFSDDF